MSDACFQAKIVSQTSTDFARPTHAFCRRVKMTSQWHEVALVTIPKVENPPTQFAQQFVSSEALGLNKTIAGLGLTNHGSDHTLQICGRLSGAIFEPCIRAWHSRFLQYFRICREARVSLLKMQIEGMARRPCKSRSQGCTRS